MSCGLFFFFQAEDGIRDRDVTGVPTCALPIFTSAWHMPRSVPEFVAVGCQVTPYPVDFRTGDATPWTEYSLARSVMLWQVALHEWLGLAVYQLTRPGKP